MEPAHQNFGGGVSHSIFNPYVLALVLIAGVLILILPRSRAIIPFLAAALMIPMDEVLLIGPYHFPTIRILIIFGAIRILWSKLLRKTEIFSGGVNGLDIAVMVLAIFTAIDGMLLWQEPQAVIFQLGNLYTVLGVYFLLRSLVRDQDDVRRVIRTLACIAAVVAAIMVSEQILGRNVYYGFLGGARANEYGRALEVREGKVRATGVFAHTILAGSFGDFCLPLFLGLWWKGERKDRKYAAVGVAAALTIVLTSNSSTVILAFVAALIGLGFWTLRRHMRIIRWGLTAGLVSLHLAMNGPVWALLTRFDISKSSSNDQRYRLINECVRHFSDWWLIGTKDYASWGWSMWDLSDTYVGTADTAGLIPLLAFVATLAFGFKYIGTARRLSDGDRKSELFIWALGASLFTNVVAFFGISYFDQTLVAWYALLAMISAATLLARKAQPVESAAAVTEIGPRVPLGVGRVPLQFKSSVNPIKKHNSPRGPQELPY